MIKDREVTMIIENYSRLPLRHAYNVRELGGYPCSGGKVTKYHSFLRADDLCSLDSTEIDYLKAYGVSAVIDLRSSEEICKYPDPMSVAEGINYINVSLLAGNISDITRVMSNDTAVPQPISDETGVSQLKTSEPDKMITEFYFQLVRYSGKELKDVFEYIIEQKGCVLFHCTAGKDRTGIVAMILLLLAGVNKADVIANYMVTEVYVSQNPIMQDLARIYPKELLQSQPAFIEPIIDDILGRYGTIDIYLQHIGLSKEVIEKLRQRL